MLLNPIEDVPGNIYLEKIREDRQMDGPGLKA